MNNYKFHFNKYSASMIFIGFVLNCMGRIIASNMNLPFYMDAYGTYLVSLTLGPIAGAISGVAMNLVFALSIPTDALYSIVSIGSAFCVGKMLYGREKTNYFFAVIVTGLAASFVTILFSTPINVILKDGMTGNIWGDALVEMLSFSINVKVICCICGEAMVNVPDKFLTLMLMVTAVEAFRKEGIFLNLGQDEEFLLENAKRKEAYRRKYELKRYERAQRKKKKRLSAILIFILAGSAALSSLASADSSVSGALANSDSAINTLTIDSALDSSSTSNLNTDFNISYTGVIYGLENGLNTSQINDIVQTSDGYIYVGTYAGLYRYDGVEFEFMDIDTKISNVKKLMVDRLDRLWIATNDSGVICYNYETGDKYYFSTEEGLCSDSIRDICDDGNGNIFISTASYISKISLMAYKSNLANYVVDQFEITNYDALSEISYTDSICAYGEEQICGVNKDGQVFALDHGNIVTIYSPTGKDYSYTSIEYSTDEDCFYIGTSSNLIEKAKLENGNFICYESIDIGDISNINYINYSSNFEGCFISAENGLAYLSTSNELENLTRSDFNASIRNMLVDVQGNVWFTSSMHGVLKLSLNPFVNAISTKNTDVGSVNSVIADGEYLYLATDSGILTVDSKGEIVENEAFKIFEGIRVRNIFKDSNKNLWISNNGSDGLVLIKADGSVRTYNSSNSEILGEHFRFCMELTDGRILAASDLGVNFIENYEVTTTLGKKDGIEVTKILSALEETIGDEVTGEPESRIYIGTDGAGVYEIRNDHIVNHFSKEEGLESQIVLKIVNCSEGRLYVASNDIYYHSDAGEITRLDNFPYTNNYDVYIDSNHMAYVSASTGMYVLEEKDLLANEESYGFTLLDYKRGLDTSLVANSFNYHKNSKLYICCSDGVRILDLDSYGDMDTHFSITISEFTQGNEAIKLTNGLYNIPAGRGQISITPCILNYTVSDPLVYIELEGIDEEGVYYRQSGLETLNYDRLPYGLHKLRIRVLSDSLSTSYKESVFLLYKNAKMYEHLYFRIYLAAVVILLVAILVWIIAKMGNMAVINRQYNEIREAKEEAENANKTKSRFLAQMSHEIRTPINAILGMDEMILRESNEADIRGYANDIYSASNTLLSLINDILDSSKLDSGKMEIAPIEYELAGLLHELVNMISWKAQAKDLNFIVQANPDLPKVLLGDDVRIRQVITNILSNAVKYTDAGSIWLRVDGTSLGDKVMLHVEVEDTGIGIKEENISKLFDEFERFDIGRNRSVEGTGLGMNITIKLLDLMGSKLEVSSIYGKGSKFSFDLAQPIINHDPMGDIRTTTNVDKKANKEKLFVAPNAKLLVVDDNAMNRKVFKSLLKRSQIQISEAASGEESITMAKSETFDIIFMDHMMPGMDGLEAMLEIRKLPNGKETPIFALTANAMAGAKEEYMQKGFDGFLSKPINIDKLMKALIDKIPESKLYYLSDEEAEKIYSGAAGTAATDPSGAAATGPAAAQAPDFLEELPAVEGLDWDYAYMHLPEKEMLEESLESFAELINVQAQKLNEFYDELMSADNTASAEATKNYRIQVHAMKSAAAIIGIVPLAGMAKILEFAAKDGKIAIIEGMHNIFINEWLSYSDKLSAFAKPVEAGEKEAGDKQMLETMLNMLNQAMESLDIDTADEIMLKVKDYSFGEEIDALMPELNTAVKDLDETKVQEIAEKMREFL
ncbi:hybrid sensor histidine kinase/response regulator [Lachnospira pectinoschiza]|uniref:Circadian input-output histidine kinase CikA n=1 Tax=Lachnospira pectinoschiza TaxID=28052 RepID=A0A1G9TL93_9FIRM|nr:response regulator [Lachnospira pectinoschiza]SDM48471.1 Signal transduction histidine kinase [Lachnospira pectinoschiza]